MTYDHLAVSADLAALLEDRPELDRHPRVVESLALENLGDLADRRDTIVWRARLAGRVARSRDRRAAWADGIIPAGNRAARRAAERLRRRGGRT